MSAPTLDGYLAFLRGVAGIGADVLPDNSPIISESYQVALENVYQGIVALGPVSYRNAVYNYATDYLINWAIDTPPSEFFSRLRKNYGLNYFTGGLTTGGSDQGTSGNIQISDALRGLNVGELTQLKTPFGRAYLTIAQPFAHVWGIT
jgi:hypothetical protein